MELKDMTNKDLIEYCESEGIDVDSKNVSKPTKTELLEAIKKFEITQALPTEDEASEAEIKDEGIIPELEMTDADEFLAVEAQKDVANGLQEKQKTKKMTRGQKRRIQYNELMPLRRVLITSNSTNQTQTKLHFITWGNGLIGHNTDRVYLGKPWHVREGALRNLEQAVITEPIQDDEGNQVKFETKPAYNIRRLDPLTEHEREKIAKRQIIRDSSIESLI